MLGSFDLRFHLTANPSAAEALDEVQAEEQAARDAAARDQVTVVDDALATADIGSMAASSSQ